MPVLLLTVTIVFWGTAFRANDAGTEHASALVFAALRAGPAAVVLLAALPLLRARLPRGRLWIWAAVTGVLMVTFTVEGMSEGTVRAGPGNAAVLVNTSPFFTLVLGRLLFGERVSWLGVGGLGMGFAGVVVMVGSQLGSSGDTGDFALGIALALGAGASWGVGTVLMKWLFHRQPGVDVVGLAAAQYLIGGAALVALAFGLKGTGGTTWSSGELWAAVAWIAVGTSAIGSIAFFLALRRIPATQAAAWGFLVPVVAVVIEAATGSRPDAVVLAGMGLAIIGVALVNVAPTRLLGAPLAGGLPERTTAVANRTVGSA